MVLPLLIFLPPSWWWWWCMSDNNKFSNQAFSTSNIIILWCLNDTTYYVLLRPYVLYVWCTYHNNEYSMYVLRQEWDIFSILWYKHKYDTHMYVHKRKLVKRSRHSKKLIKKELNASNGWSYKTFMYRKCYQLLVPVLLTTYYYLLLLVVPPPVVLWLLLATNY